MAFVLFAEPVEVAFSEDVAPPAEVPERVADEDRDPELLDLEPDELLEELESWARATQLNKSSQSHPCANRIVRCPARR